MQAAISLVVDSLDSPDAMEIARGVMSAATEDSDGASVTLAPAGSPGTLVWLTGCSTRARTASSWSRPGLTGSQRRQIGTSQDAIGAYSI